MAIKVSRKDILWNYAGSILNIGMGFFILPVVLHMLSSQELGLWYVFGSIAGLVTLVDFGFSPTIMRNITYCWCGAKEIFSEGVPQVEKGVNPNYSLLKSMIAASKKIYLILSLIAGVLLITVGTIYIYELLPQKEMKYLIAWLIYALAVFINLYYSYWSPLLKGIGAFKEANQAMIISKAIYIIFSIIGLLIGGGLIWLSLMYLISGLILRILSKIYFLKLAGKEYSHQKIDNGVDLKKIFTIIWPNSKKLGIVTIGGWLITRSTTLLCSNYLGLEVTAQYGLSIQLLSVIGGLSSLLFNSYIPEITSSKISYNNERYNQVFSRAIALQWLVGLVGIVSLVILGPISLKLIGSNASLLPGGILTLLGIILFLEWNHSTFAELFVLSNSIPFVGASIYSGIAIVAISLVLLNFTNLGILGLIISQGLVQLAYNNWYWPMLILRQNSSSIAKIVNSSFKDAKSLLSNIQLTKNI